MTSNSGCFLLTPWPAKRGLLCSGENAVVKEGVGESATADTGEIVSEEAIEEATGDETLDIFADVIVGIFCL